MTANKHKIFRFHVVTCFCFGRYFARLHADNNSYKQMCSPVRQRVCICVCVSVCDCALYCCILTDSQVLFISVLVFVYKQSPFLIGIFIFIYLFRRFCHAVLQCASVLPLVLLALMLLLLLLMPLLFFSLRPNDKWLFSFDYRLAKSLGAVAHFFPFSRIYFIIYGVGILYVFVIKM